MASQNEQSRREEAIVDVEARMRSIVDHVIDGIITIDARGIVDSFNPAAEKIFGYSRAEIVGQNVKMLMPDPYQEQHDAYIGNYLRTGAAKIIGIGREVVGLRKDGTTFPMDLAVSEFQIGGERYFTGIVRDITLRKQLESELRERVHKLGELERELRRRVDELAEADRQKNEFLAMLGHELRNPLAPMRNAVHLLQMPGAEETILNRAREMLERQLQHIVRLVDDLLDVSRIIRGTIELRRQRMDLGAAIARALETTESTMDSHGHELNVTLPGGPTWIEGDVIRLAQAIGNLLANAAKYSPRPGRIWLSLERGAGTAVVRLRDSGIGIDSKLLPHVFDLFVQGDHSLARSHGGLGIGLTLVKRVCEMHGGSISATSAGAGQGSEFTMTLPLSPPAQEEKPSQPQESEQRIKGQGRRVLVVDDNVDAAETIAMVLRLYGHQVSCVYDGPSALTAAEQDPPDIMVVDIGLPGINGYEVATRIREDPRLKAIPLVALTGYGQAQDRVLARRAGFDAHMTKPVDPEKLDEYLRSAQATRH
jgi:PAS domain S-box-containing protein